MFRVRTLVFQRRRSAEEREELAILKELIAAESGELEKKQTNTVIIEEMDGRGLYVCIGSRSNLWRLGI